VGVTGSYPSSEDSTAKLLDRTRITLVIRQPELSLGADGPPFWQRLAFQMEPQEQSNWCWAAVATSVAHAYDNSSTWTQCEVANGELGRSDCCAGGAGTACNVYGTLDTSLSRVGHLDHVDSSAASWQMIHDQIAGGCPLGIRVAWAGGGAHFLVAYGWLQNDFVAVDDPIYGKSDIAYDALTTSYQGSGTWTNSYYTRR
jgi:hypothetical protein